MFLGLELRLVVVVCGNVVLEEDDTGFRAAVLCRVTREGLSGVVGCMVICGMIGEEIILPALGFSCDVLDFFLECWLGVRF
jgi:hypothetical protein